MYMFVTSDVSYVDHTHCCIYARPLLFNKTGLLMSHGLSKRRFAISESVFHKTLVTGKKWRAIVLERRWYSPFPVS